MKNQEHLDKLRHSTAHLLAAAVMEIYPHAKRAIGPATKDGFYYDFDNLKISEEDLSKIERKMRQILPNWVSFEKKMLDRAEAKKAYPNNPFKHELIDEFSQKGKKKVSFYQSGDYQDLCRGGHVESPSSEIKAFKLLSVAGAYWRGDEKNKMLTRIYGTAFQSQKELDEYLKLLEKVKKHDHRVLGKTLDLFVFSDLIGKGLPILTPKGSVIRRELERFIVDEEIKRGYQHVFTPVLAKTDLYKKSGHYPYYKDTMYPPMKIDEEELILRPMTCPHHFMLYKSKSRSYKDLPMRFAELSPQFRYEKSGELTGLMRVRTFCLADAHIMVTKPQALAEIISVLDLIDYVNKTLGMTKGVDYRYRLSLGDQQDSKKYYQDSKAWKEAEQVLREVLVKTKAPFFEALNEAAFYGPKIDVQVKNVAGKEETAFTVQYDFVMPKRFEMTYINQKGQMEEPVVIHRSSIGAFERTMAFLIEHYAGNFPTWLTPVQVKILPISDRQNNYAEIVLNQLKANNIRAELDDRAESLGAKIRDAQIEKVSYMLVIGDKEVKAKTVSVRGRGRKDWGKMIIDQFIARIDKEIKGKDIQ